MCRLQRLVFQRDFVNNNNENEVDRNEVPSNALNSFDLSTYENSSVEYQDIKNLEEIFDSIPASNDYTLFEYQVATTLARLIYRKYNCVLFDNEIKLNKKKVIFKHCILYEKENCGGITYPCKTTNKVDRIELSMQWIRNSYRMKKTLLHEMCHAYRYFEENDDTPHGSIWLENVDLALGNMHRNEELKTNLNVTSIPDPLLLFKSYPSKFKYQCSECLQFTNQMNVCPNKRCKTRKTDLMLVKLDEKNNKVAYISEGAMRKLFFRYEIWKRTQRADALSFKRKKPGSIPSCKQRKDKIPVTAETSKNVIRIARETLTVIRDLWNSMPDGNRRTYDRDLLQKLKNNKNEKYFSNLLE